MGAEQRLSDLGITLPDPPAPVAAYVPYVRSGALVFLSGQVGFRGGRLERTGSVGADVSPEEAAEEARICGLNALAVLREAVGSLDAVARIVKVTVFVASAQGFRAHPAVANGASELFIEIFGDAGRHARTTVGVAELPLGAPVEVEVVAEVAGL